MAAGVALLAGVAVPSDAPDCVGVVLLLPPPHAVAPIASNPNAPNEMISNRICIDSPWKGRGVGTADWNNHTPNLLAERQTFGSPPRSVIGRGVRPKRQAASVGRAKQKALKYLRRRRALLGYSEPSAQGQVCQCHVFSDPFLPHAADRELQVVAFGERWQDRVVECGTVQGFEHPAAAGLAGTGLDTCQKVVLPEVTGAR